MPRPILVLATLNAAKLAELRGLLGDIGHDVRPLSDWPGAALPEEIEHTWLTSLDVTGNRLGCAGGALPRSLKQAGAVQVYGLAAQRCDLAQRSN